MERRKPARFALRRLSGLNLVVALTALLVAFPFVEKLAAGAVLQSILITIVLISAVVAISHRSRVAVAAAVLAAPTLASRWISLYRPDVLPPAIFLIGGILLVLFVTVNLLRFILTAAVVTSDVLFASISAFLLFGLLWTFAYWLVAELIPNAFQINVSGGGHATMTGFNSLYFSFITLSTVGYGDITPVAGAARMLAAMEAMFGLLYVAVLIARLVSLQTSPKPNAEQAP